MTASPQVQTPDLATHTMPDHIVQITLSDSSTVQTTGMVSLAGTQAHGTVLLTNSSTQPITIPAQFILTTPSGVRVQTTQTVQIPPHHDGEDGKNSTSAQAVNPGTAGNIPAHALDGTCCNNGVSATNPAPFSGGTDAQMVHAVTQADIDSAKNTLAAKLQSQVARQLQKKLGGDEIIAGQPKYEVTASPSSPVGTQTDQVQVLVRLAGTVVGYSRNVVNHIAAQLLSQQATKTLGSPYQLQGTPSIDMPKVVQQGNNGLIYLSVSVHGLWVYPLSPEQMRQWRQSIKGAPSAAALAYLTTQAGVGAVQIHLPFGTDHLPLSLDDIKIVLVSTLSTS